MKNEYINLIRELDKVLSTLRDFWMNARDTKEKSKWMERLNQSLDERSRLMRCRDGLAALEVDK